MTNADAYLYEETLDSELDISPMQDREILQVYDQNGGSYNNQIQFDTSTLANSGRWISYREGVLEIPFVFTAKCSVDATAVVNSFMLGLKNGYYQLIDSIQVDFNNTNVVQQQSFTNFYVNYKLMTSMSADDLKKHGPAIGFIPDSAGSYQFSNLAVLNGDGYSNNLVYPLTAPVYGTPSGLDTYNAGFANRLKTTGFPAGVLSLHNSVGGVPTIGGSNAASLANQIGKNYATDNGVAAAGNIIQWTVIATIRLKDVADFFDKLPLVRGASLKINVNYNSATTVVASTAYSAGPPAVLQTLSMTSVSVLAGRTNPLLMASSASNNPTPLNITGTYTISCGVVRCLNSFVTPPMQSCRLYVPAFIMNPIYMDQLLSTEKVREVVYTDIYNYNISNIGAGASFNQILTNGITNPKKLIMIPFANSSVSSSVFRNVTVPVYQSIFDTAPGTTTPMAAITQFNVLVGGVNIFQQNFQYDFEEFVNEVQQANAINGGDEMGFTSGLLSQYDWDNGYRYYVADISRRIPAEANKSLSVAVQGINNTAVAMDYVCFISFERRVRINLETGAVVG